MSTATPQGTELPAPTAIINLLSRYAELIDNGEFEAIGELFAHATVTADNQGTWTGAAEVTGMYNDFTRKHEDGTPRTKHVITNHIVELDGPDNGRCRSYFTVFMCTATLPLQPIVAGRYADEFERIDGVWWYTRRKMTIEFVGDVSEHLNMTLSR
jgi:3-phenylpropionate/cinnamic acid dioxygenase small subunit